ncbi:DUF3048 domain-containing protein [Patescibacteria group bacterium]|nr:DUF3048 domain-containing protein [Patescibacteria group bacterium]
MLKEKMSFVTGKKFMIVLSFLGLYFLSTGVSWALFSFLRSDSGIATQDLTGSRAKIDPNLPKTEECPINGQMFSEPERDIWEERRPITAIIENHSDSRPQSGLSSADVVYEAVAEGGITRFLAVYYCGASADDIRISPIRSVRVYFIDWAAEYGKEPIFVHIGGANNICNNCPGGTKPYGDVAKEVNAFAVLTKLGWRYAKGNDFDGGTNVGYPIIIRDQYRLGDKAAWEHSVVGFTDKIFDEASERGFGYKDDQSDPWDDDFVSWKFTDGYPSGSVEADNISFEFWEGMGDYDVSWKYDSTTNSYLRTNGGKEHIDHETQKQLSAKNVVVQFVNEKGPVDKEFHMFYTTIGSGEALIFQNGEAIEGTWEKKLQTSRTVFYDGDGVEIEFVRGPIWIEAVPKGNKIKY